MSIRNKLGIRFLSSAVGLAASFSAVAAEENYVTIGTGSQTGVY